MLDDNKWRWVFCGCVAAIFMALSYASAFFITHIFKALLKLDEREALLLLIVAGIWGLATVTTKKLLQMKDGPHA